MMASIKHAFYKSYSYQDDDMHPLRLALSHSARNKITLYQLHVMFVLVLLWETWRHHLYFWMYCRIKQIKESTLETQRWEKNKCLRSRSILPAARQISGCRNCHNETDDALIWQSAKHIRVLLFKGLMSRSFVSL